MGKANTNIPSVKISPLQAASALALAGWPSDQWATGVAVGMQESSLDATVENEVGADGWLQILKSSHPDLFKALNPGDAWMDPVTNAKMAYSVYKSAPGGPSWHPWQAYSSGDYQKYLPAAQKAVAQLQHDIAGLNAQQKNAYYLKLWQPTFTDLANAQIKAGLDPVLNSIGQAAGAGGQFVTGTGNAVVDSVGQLVQELTTFSDFFQSLLLPSTWIRIGSGILGIGLIVGGLVMLGKEAAGSNG